MDLEGIKRELVKYTDRIRTLVLLKTTVVVQGQVTFSLCAPVIYKTYQVAWASGSLKCSSFSKNPIYWL